MVFIEIVVFGYFLYTTLYTLVLFVAGWFYRDKDLTNLQTDKKFRFCVLIPAYKEDGVIISVAKAALSQNYPPHLYKVVVIADSLQQQTLNELSKLGIELVTVKFSQSTKVRSLNAAFEKVSEDFDYAVILDADNIMEEDFLLKMNRLHNLGISSVQAQRIPKNKNSSMAVLDGISEAINYHIVSKGNTVLGGSPGVKGSGISFPFSTIKNIFASLDSVGGFDRELELRLMLQNIPIYYSADTVVSDEKVNSIEVFKRQRTRWISSQFFYLRKYFGNGVRMLFKGKFAYFNSSVLRNIQLPRLLNIGLLGLIVFVVFLLRNYLSVHYTWWVLLFAVNCITIFFSIPKDFYDRKLGRAVLQLPSVFLNMIMLLFRLKGANKKFIHTPHGATPSNDGIKT